VNKIYVVMRSEDEDDHPEMAFHSEIAADKYCNELQNKTTELAKQALEYWKENNNDWKKPGFKLPSLRNFYRECYYVEDVEIGD
jgi:hypothetical protein